MEVEAGHAVAEQPDALQQVVRDQRLEDIELEIAAGGADAQRHVIAHDLGAQHGQRLALGRIDLAGHDRAAGLVFRQAEFAQAGARAGGQPADVVADLHQRDSQRLERAMHRHQAVVRGQCRELVVSAAERQAVAAGQCGGDPLAEFGVGVESGADRCAADGQRIEPLQCSDQPRARLAQLGRVAGKLLAQGDRGGILQMGAADLDDVGKSQCLLGQGRLQAVERR